MQLLVLYLSGHTAEDSYTQMTELALMVRSIPCLGFAKRPQLD